MPYIIEMREVSKTYPGIVANEGITLQVATGEVHAILGDSGAGKSTLISILAGLLPLDSGSITVANKPVCLASAHEAVANGIGIIHQQPRLVPHFSVTEQLMLGNEHKRVLSFKEGKSVAATLIERYGFSFTPEARIATLSHVQQQQVAILQLLYRDARILLFDNPTAGRTPDERADLFAFLRRLAKEKRACVFTSRSPDEVVEVADSATVLRAGKLVERIAIKSESAPLLTALMGKAGDVQIDTRRVVPGAQVLLEVRDVRVRNKGVLAVNGVTLTVRAGEILALAGAEGHGQRVLAETIVGLKQIESGSIIIDGNDISHATTRRRSELGLGYLPAERAAKALMLDRSLEDNLALKAYRHPPYRRGIFLDREAVAEYAHVIAEEYGFAKDIPLQRRASTLSPSEQAHLILAREMHQSKLLIVVEPIQGVDNQTAGSIREHLIDYRDRGNAVLLVTAQLEEWLHLADRIAVLHAGELVNIIDSAESDRNRLERMMCGIRGRSEV